MPSTSLPDHISQHIPLHQNSMFSNMNNTPPAKRARVALACQRCKSRKQRCDGCNPCSKCRALDLTCEYVIPQKPMPFGKNHYIRSLEHRVAELESLLSAQGVLEPSTDHWRTTARSTTSSGATASTSIPADLNPPQVRNAVSVAGHSDHDDEVDSGIVGDQDEAVLDWQDGVDSVVSVLRSLSLDVNGSGYMGASSHVALGRLFAFLAPQSGINGQGAQTHHTHHHGRRKSQAIQLYNAPTPTPNSFNPSPSHDSDEPISLSDIPPDVADRLLSGYMKHICTRRPVVHSLLIRDIHSRRDTLTSPYEISLLHLVYACGGRFLETTGERFSPPGQPFSFSPKRHYTSSLRYLDAVLSYNDTRTVAILMLMAVYCLRDPVGPGAWTYSRTAMLIAIDCGLHRQTKASKRLSLESELRKRLFWTCYAFDRQISIPMGRPFAISDRDIDVALPLDVDEEITEEELLRVAATMNTAAEGSKSPGRPSHRTTSLSSFIHLVRLRRIESDIQQTIYRVDEDCVSVSDEVIDGFLQTLEEWKSCIPADAHKKKDLPGVPFDGYDFYMVFYYKTLRVLLYPQLTRAAHGEAIAPRFLKTCAKACAGACGAYKRLHQSLAVGYSIMALQTVFMAGLTLIYCIWISPADIFDMVTSNGINDCSIVLFVIAERVPAGKKYRNAFEVIRQRVIERITSLESEGGRRPGEREVVVGLGREVAAEYRGHSAYSYGSQGMSVGENGESGPGFSGESGESRLFESVDEGSFEQFSQIITAMTGEDFSTNMGFGRGADGIENGLGSDNDGLFGQGFGSGFGDDGYINLPDPAEALEKCVQVDGGLSYGDRTDSARNGLNGLWRSNMRYI